MMKRLLVVLAAVSILFSCKKNASSATPSSSSSLVKTMSGRYPLTQTRTVFNFRYNASQQMTSFSFYNYDTTGGIAYLDTVGYYFTLNASTGLPTGYTFYALNAFFGPNTETHGLTYDGTGRLIKDTTLTGQANPGDSSANYFSYPAGKIVVRDYSLYAYDTVNMSYGWGASALDTIVLNNGNYVAQYEYTQNSTTWQLSESNIVSSYSTYANPLYNTHYSNSIGAFILDTDYFDCLSKDLPAEGVRWTTDASGRVVSGLSPDGSSITYTYQ